ncbi:MAG: putative amidase [Rhodoferax sp.]|nr:putative amidase [Rhodoferax sp.]
MAELPASIACLQSVIDAGALQPDEAIALQRRRLQRLDRRFHAVVALLPDAPDAPPGATGSLRGVGLAHKDLFTTAGRQPGLGHDAGRADAAVQDAPVLARLAHHGATTLASLVMAEYACGATGFNPNFPRCVNPLHAEACVGGSSSGSAVAVAAGMVYGALCTDTAGSVRMPAATCGLLGLKTTAGLLPLQGVFPLAPSLDSVGLLARNADDLRRILQAAAEPGRLHAPASHPLRLAAWLPEAGLHGAIHAAMQALASAMAMQQVDTLDAHPVLTQLSEIVLHTEAARTHHAALLDGSLPPGVEAVALPGLVLPAAWHAAALGQRGRQLRSFVEQHLAHHDILVLPALPIPIPDWAEVTPTDPAFDGRKLLALYRYMGFINYLGLPALVVPIALDARGLPISVQLVARPFHELTLLRCAEQLAAQHFRMEGPAPSRLLED